MPTSNPEGLHPQLFLSSGCTPPQVLSAGPMALNPSLDQLLPRGHSDMSLAPALWAPATSLLGCLSYVRTEHVKTKLLSLNLCPLSSPITTNEPPPTLLLGQKAQASPAILPFPLQAIQQQVQSSPDPNEFSKLPISLQFHCCGPGPTLLLSHLDLCRSLLTSHLASILSLAICALTSDRKRA